VDGSRSWREARGTSEGPHARGARCGGARREAWARFHDARHETRGVRCEARGQAGRSHPKRMDAPRVLSLLF
jgi:hypothetical protein